MDMLKSENDENVTLEFYEACLRGDLDKATNLLSRKEEIDVKLLDKTFVLESVVMNGDSEIVQLLSRIGVNVNQKDYLFGLSSLYYACALGNLKIAKILIENRADINASIKFSNRTSLHIASQYKNPEIVKLLLENGCKTEIRTQEGFTALEIALKKGFIGIVQVFAFHNK